MAFSCPSRVGEGYVDIFIYNEYLSTHSGQDYSFLFLSASLAMVNSSLGMWQ